MYKMQMYILERDTMIILDIQIQFQLDFPPLLKKKKKKKLKASYRRSC